MIVARAMEASGFACRPRLPPGLAAACGLGLLDRAEPASALVDPHFDPRAPAAGRLVIDAFTGAVDIALDGAVGRGRNGPRRRSEQDRLGIWRRLGGAEGGGLLVAHPPVPGRDDGALPHPRFGFARRLFDRLVVLGQAGVGQRPAVLHQPFLDVLAIDLAARDLAAAAVD